MNDTSEQEILTNLTNAHNALSNTVNKHIEFTTALADKVKSEAEYNSEVQCKLTFKIQRAQLDILELSRCLHNIQKLCVHIIILYICTLIIMITIGWKLI